MNSEEREQEKRTRADHGSTKLGFPRMRELEMEKGEIQRRSNSCLRRGFEEREGGYEMRSEVFKGFSGFSPGSGEDRVLGEGRGTFRSYIFFYSFIIIGP